MSIPTNLCGGGFRLGLFASTLSFSGTVHGGISLLVLWLSSLCCGGLLCGLSVTVSVGLGLAGVDDVGPLKFSLLPIEVS